MKKAYEKPLLEAIDMSERTELLQGSVRSFGLFDDDDDSPGNSAFGHETACSHGHHKWFCD